MQRAQRILDERGYIVMARTRIPCVLGEILPHAHRGTIPGPMRVVGFADYGEFFRQCEDFPYPSPVQPPPMPPEAFVQFVKVVAE